MKIAYHFNCSNLQVFYSSLFYKIVFSEILKLNFAFVSSKVLVGDLLIYRMVNNDNYEIFLNNLFQSTGDNLKRLREEKIESFFRDNVFVICFETIQKELAIALHEVLMKEDRYLGAYEIDDLSELHWMLYGECITPKFRILNKDINILVDNYEDEDQDFVKSVKEELESISFNNIGIEFSNFRYSIFNDKHNYENAKRTKEWRNGTESIFSTITDEILAKLTDTAPDLINKLWAINYTFFNAQTGEQYAQAMTSCRRVFEYVIDCLFPPNNDIVDGHQLKKNNYKNRLFEFAKQEVSKDVNIDLIVTNTSSLFEEWNKLNELSNKGVHSEPHKQECRRCIIRTILLLDDLIALKRTPFQVNIIADNFIGEFKKKYNSNL
ncbi:hypothetical protein [Flavobacterium sp. FlaQc-47]|uniref:hypothetical protein n=1 Tax=Flavobacterium sp. FlaQc-47 TaxID=3374180 RepID=UPI0037567507